MIEKYHCQKKADQVKCNEKTRVLKKKQDRAVAHQINEKSKPEEQIRKERSSRSYNQEQNNVTKELSEKKDITLEESKKSNVCDKRTDPTDNYQIGKENYEELQRKFRESLLRIEQSKSRSRWVEKYIDLLAPPGEDIVQTLDHTMLTKSTSSISPEYDDTLSDSFSDCKHLEGFTSGYSASPSSSSSGSSGKYLNESKVHLDDTINSDMYKHNKSCDSSYGIISNSHSSEIIEKYDSDEYKTSSSDEINGLT
jgi:hypothetical protein